VMLLLLLLLLLLFRYINTIAEIGHCHRSNDVSITAV
jgi:hypothetical protein